MGTSLSGLTPATTFDGLLKTSDNDALDATLKTIGTGDGTDSVLQLSDSALQIGGTFNVDGGIATFKGVGSSYLTSSFIIKNSADAEIFRVRDDAQIYAAYISAQSVNASSYALYGADYAPNIRVNIKGSGATSATTSLLVQNSAGSDMFKVADDGAIDFGALGLEFSNDGSGGTMSVASDRYVKIATSLNTYSALNAHVFKTLGSGGYSEAMRITGNTDQFVGIGETTPTARLHLKGSGNGNTTTSLLVQNSDGNSYFNVKDGGDFGLGAATNNLSGSNNNIFFRATNTYFRASGGDYLGNFRAGGFQIGNGSAAATARLQVKGSGATSATTALLVQNSAGTELFKLTDDGTINLGVPGDNPTIQSGSNAGKSLTLGSTATLSALNINLSTYNGINYTPVLSVTGNTDQFVGIGETTPTARLQVKGSGNDATTTALLVQNSDGTDLFKVFDAGATRINTETLSSTIIGKNGTGGAFVVDAGRVNNVRADVNGVGINSTSTANTSLTIKGQGATSATTALLVQNSAGTELFKVQDDGRVDFASLFAIGTNIYGTNSSYRINIASSNEYQTYDSHIFKTYDGAAYSESMRIVGNGASPKVGIGETNPTAKLQVKGSGNDATTTALLVQNSAGTTALEVLDNRDVKLTLGTYQFLSSGFISYAKGNVNSDFGVGFTTNPTARLQVKGSGATSATTALLVENSAGTDLLKVEDGGDVKIDNGVAADLKVKISPTDVKYIELDRQGRQVRFYSGATGNAGIFMAQADKFSIGTNNTSLILLDENSNVRIGSGITAANTSAKLQVDSTTQGFLPPRMTDAERDAITSPAAGLMIYDTSNNQMNYWNGSSWIAF